jgi:hypothetical protein
MIVTRGYAAPPALASVPRYHPEGSLIAELDSPLKENDDRLSQDLTDEPALAVIERGDQPGCLVWVGDRTPERVEHLDDLYDLSFFHQSLSLVVLGMGSKVIKLLGR